MSVCVCACDYARTSARDPLCSIMGPLSGSQIYAKGNVNISKHNIYNKIYFKHVLFSISYESGMCYYKTPLNMDSESA